MKLKPILVRVVAPYFVAGIEITDDLCVRAAPILQWTVGKTSDQLRRSFAAKSWQASIIDKTAGVL